MRKLRLYLVRHRAKVKTVKMLIISLIGCFSYFFNFHYELFAPLCCMLIFIEANSR